MPTFLYIYEQYKFHAQLSWALKDVITSGPGAGFALLLTLIRCILCTPSRAFGRACPSHCNSIIGRAQWLSGRELDSRRTATGSSFNSVTALCPWARHINPSLALVQPRTTRPHITDRLLMGRKESNKRTAESAW